MLARLNIIYRILNCLQEQCTLCAHPVYIAHSVIERSILSALLATNIYAIAVDPSEQDNAVSIPEVSNAYLPPIVLQLAR